MGTCKKKKFCVLLEMRNLQLIVLNDPHEARDGFSSADPNHRFLLTLLGFCFSQHGTSLGSDFNTEEEFHEVIRNSTLVKRKSKILEHQQLQRFIAFSGDIRAYFLSSSEPIEMNLWNCRVLDQQCAGFRDHTVSTSN